MKKGPIKRLIVKQRTFARYLEIAYIHSVDKPLTANEVRCKE